MPMIQMFLVCKVFFSWHKFSITSINLKFIYKILTFICTWFQHIYVQSGMTLLLLLLLVLVLLTLLCLQVSNCICIRSNTIYARESLFLGPYQHICVISGLYTHTPIIFYICTGPHAPGSFYDDARPVSVSVPQLYIPVVVVVVVVMVVVVLLVVVMVLVMLPLVQYVSRAMKRQMLAILSLI